MVAARRSGRSGGSGPLRCRTGTIIYVLAVTGHGASESLARPGSELRDVGDGCVAERRTPGGPRPRVLFVAWSAVAGRADEIAAALGGQAVSLYQLGSWPAALTPLKWLVRALLTLAWLGRTRPRALIVTNPPIFPGLMAWLYGRATGTPVVLDSHPGGFGLQGDPIGRLARPLHRFLARRVAATIVASEALAEEVRGWGGRAYVVHEAPLDGISEARCPPPAPPRVLYPGLFARDEPYRAVLGAATLLPGCEFVVTGDLERADAGAIAAAPANVRFAGFLQRSAYLRELEAATVVVALSTEPQSAMRAGFEAGFAVRPLVATEGTTRSAAFPFARLTANDAPSLAAAVAEVLDDYPRALERARRARVLQHERWARQLAEVRHDVGAAEPPAR